MLLDKQQAFVDQVLDLNGDPGSADCQGGVGHFDHGCLAHAEHLGVVAGQCRCAGDRYLFGPGGTIPTAGPVAAMIAAWSCTAVASRFAAVASTTAGSTET